MQKGVDITIFGKGRGIAGGGGGRGGGGKGGGVEEGGVEGGRVQGGRVQGGGKPCPYISGEHTPPFATVHHADLWGLREVYQFDTRGKVVLTSGKYSWLAQHDLASTQWMILNPQAPYYL